MKPCQVEDSDCHERDSEVIDVDDPALPKEAT